MRKLSGVFLVMMAVMAVVSMPVYAKEDKIESGIYVNDIDLSGMTLEEARQKIESYVASYGEAPVTLHAIDEGTVVTTASELGLRWGNEEILEEAANFGRDGDILRCYKELKDLEYNNKV